MKDFIYHLIDFNDKLHIRIFKLDPCDIQTARKMIKQQISNLMNEL